MTDLDRMILAARQIGEVVGEDLTQRIYMMDDGVYLDTKWRDTPIYDQDALDLLTARVEKAMWGWSDARGTGWSVCKDEFRDYVVFRDFFDERHETLYDGPDLPSAVAAIYKHWSVNRTAGEALPKILNKMADDLENRNA